MTTNSRPVFSFYPDPKLRWNEVSDAVYKFKLINKETSEEIWSIDESNPHCNNGTCYCDYPQDKPLLEPLVSYLLVAEANNGKSIREFQTEVILLEEKAQKAFHELGTLIEDEQKPALTTAMQFFIQAMSGKRNGGNWNDDCRKCSRIGVNF